MALTSTIWDLLAPYECLSCGREGELVCAQCWPRLFRPPPPVFTRYHTATCYGYLAKELVRSMKVDCYRQAGTLIGRALAEVMPRLSPGAIVTSVPTADARRRERGFDHGALIAKEFARTRGVEYRALLIRHGRLKQAGTSATTRRSQVRGVFAARRRASISGNHIVLIDDVITTGSTLDEAMRVLKRNGAASVTALVFAQTV